MEHEETGGVHDGEGWVAHGGGTACNLLINAGFQVSQRGFAGGMISVGTYGDARWKAGPAGCEMSVVEETVLLVSGTVLQIV